MAVSEEVQRGAKLLDKIVPGWHRRVNLERLYMSNGDLCMLGQLFGRRAETAIAKEMYPEMWRKFSDSGYGYDIGLSMIPAMLREQLGLKPHETGAFWNSDLGKEWMFLHHACSGHDNRCEWAEEVAKRMEADEAAEQVSQMDPVEDPDPVRAAS